MGGSGTPTKTAQTKEEPLLPRKRDHTQISTTSNISRTGPTQDIFRTPTADDITTALALRSNPSQARALRSLQNGEHISSSVIDDTITLSLRPLLPTNTTVLFCTDSVLIPDTTNRRNHRRVANIINTHDIRLLLLNASNHWFLAEINNATKTVALHNSAGTLGYPHSRNGH